MPDVITIPWFKVPSSRNPWNTSSRSSAGWGNTMAWCLFEALRDDDCKFLATEDSRASVLLTKWVACGGSGRCGLALQLATRPDLCHVPAWR